MFKFLIVLLTSLALISCATATVIQRTSPNSYASALRSGDKVRVTTVNGQVYELTVSSVTQDTLTGANASGQTETIRVRDIQILEKKSVSAPKTTGAVIGVIVLVIAASFALVAHALNKGP